MDQPQSPVVCMASLTPGESFVCQLINNQLESSLEKQCPGLRWMSETPVELLENIFSPDLLNHNLREGSRSLSFYRLYS